MDFTSGCLTEYNLVDHLGGPDVEVVEEQDSADEEGDHAGEGEADTEVQVSDYEEF